MPKKADTGGKAVIEKGNIVIRVPVDALQAVIDGAFALNGIDTRYKITDKKMFAREVVRELNSEDEQGSTPFHKMFDEAMCEAIGQGAEGVEEHPDQDFFKIGPT